MSRSSEIAAQLQPVPELQMWLFGQFSVRLHGDPLPPLHSRKGAWLLALLVLKDQQPVDRSWLAATLWPDSDHRESLQNLRNILNNLRIALGSQRDRIQSPTPGTLHLDLSQAHVDLKVFDANVKRGDSGSLSKAVDLYRGCLLEGCDEEWVVPEREQRQQSCLEALETLANFELQAGAAAQAVRHLHTAISIDPFRETVQCALMSALAATGDFAGVTQVYRDFRIQLREHLNTHPAAETVALYEKIRTRARQVAAGGATPLSTKSNLRPSGHRSDNNSHHKSEGRPYGVAVPHNIPPPVTSFVGRENDRARLTELMAKSRLLTLTGAGGSGKTRLALEVAGERASTYSDGAWLVELAAISDPVRVVQAAATALNIREQPGAPLLHTLVDSLRHKSMLLVLDNCEHLLAASGELAAALLRGCPSLRLLATSRERLGIAGEQMYRVPSLSLPNLSVDMTAESIHESESVRLFEARACLIRSDFRVSQHNAANVARVCHRLDGIPLAIELAAARVRSLSVEELQHRLDDRFHLLTGGDRSAMPRQQTLRALIDWSYDLLSEPEKRLLQRLSVFAGGWSLQAAEAVVGGREEVLDLLTSLVDKSMVQCEERGDAIRYRLLETMRQYAQDRQVEYVTNNEVRNRHSDFYLTLAELAEPQLQGVHQAEWLRRLEEEHENLRAALDWSINGREDVSGKNYQETEGESTPTYHHQPAPSRFCMALQLFWQMRGHLTEGRAWCDRTLQMPACQERTRERARVVNGAGTLARMQCDFVAARRHVEESLDIRRQIGDCSGIASSLIGLGNVAISLGDNASALTHYQESLDICLETGDRSNAASSYIGLGIVASSQGDYPAARAYYEDSLTIMRRIGAPSGIARTLSNVGNAAFDQGDHVSARNYYQESLSIEEEIGNRSGIAHALGNLGNVAWSQGDHDAASAYYQRSLTIKKEIGDRNGIANTLNNLGTVAQEQGDCTSAQAYFGESLTIYQSTGDRKGITAALGAFAGLAAITAKFEQAAALWGAAERLREEIGSPMPPNEREKYNTTVSEVHRALGGDVAFDAAWARGRAMELDEGIALAMSYAAT